MERRRRMLAALAAAGPGANLRLIADLVYCLVICIVRALSSGRTRAKLIRAVLFRIEGAPR